jgi:hypothetical protein
MYRSCFSQWKSALAGLVTLPVLCGVTSADGPPRDNRDQQAKPIAAAPAPAPVATAVKPFNPLDFTKSRIEIPTQRLLAMQSIPGAPAPVVIRDAGKGKIERPVETTVAKSTTPVADKGDKNDNPKVEPGKVKWHKDFASACAASKKSGKPVLLFQMMGKLDEKFC